MMMRIKLIPKTDSQPNIPIYLFSFMHLPVLYCHCLLVCMYEVFFKWIKSLRLYAKQDTFCISLYIFRECMNEYWLHFYECIFRQTWGSFIQFIVFIPMIHDDVCSWKMIKNVCMLYFLQFNFISSTRPTKIICAMRYAINCKMCM